MIEIDDRDLDVLLAEDPGGPVVMLNLLRFRPDGGRESYQRYAEAVGGAGRGCRRSLYLGSQLPKRSLRTTSGRGTRYHGSGEFTLRTLMPPVGR